MPKSKIKRAKYMICNTGIASHTVGSVTIDGKIALIADYLQCAFYLCPVVPHSQPTYQKAWFFSDCISYEHDIPAIVYPSATELREFKYRFIHYGPTKPQKIEAVTIGKDRSDKEEVKNYKSRPLGSEFMTTTFYLPKLREILTDTRDLRHGPLTYVLFRYFPSEDHIDLPFTKRYGQVSQEVHLYAAALRQADPLSEFLHYYRVIESSVGTNHKKWIKNSLLKISKHQYGQLLIGHEDILHPTEKPKDIMKVCRRRALLRLKTLANRVGNPSDIADYLYTTNRCGIAHGRKILRSDLTPTYFETVKDTYILKLLARIAIDEKTP